MSEILTLQNIRYSYPKSKTEVLKGITCSFETGKLYCIMGKSGAGKSTLLAMLAGLDRPTEGRIFFDQADTAALDRDLYRSQKVGVIFQSYNLLQNASAVENIVLSMNISHSKQENKKEFACRLLEKVGICREKAGRVVLRLSGGEQQRVVIGMILDEPGGKVIGIKLLG